MITIIDFRYFIIPDELNFLILFLGLILAIIGELLKLKPNLIASEIAQEWIKLFNFQNFILGILFAAGLLFVIAYLCSKLLGRDAMGGGDIKLIAAIGSVLGIKGSIFTLAISSIVGSIFGIFFLLKAKLINKNKGYTMIAYGPYIIIAALIVIYFGDANLSRLYEEFSFKLVNFSLNSENSAILSTYAR